MSADIVVLGVPFALGGWYAEMEAEIVDMTLAPTRLREGGLLDRLAPGTALLVDAGDVALDPAWCIDEGSGIKNREAVLEALPRVRHAVREALAAGGRLVALGGECSIYPAMLAGLTDAVPGRRLGLVYLDAHGDFNTTETTTVGDVWGMPLALATGRGEADLVAAGGGRRIEEADCALLGGQVLDELESRALAASAIAHFGAGMLAGDAGMAAFDAWLAVVSRRVDAFFVAFDVDAIDAGAGLAVALPEPHGLSLETAVEAVTRVARHAPVAGVGVTTVALAHGDAAGTIDACAHVIRAALGLAAAR
jgi:arginase